ncbi:hypothetical protein [Promicromonospora kroppenstedtii]|uniref:hypothetical protein n=1 Tax=Promicromonospora kroppenstedtii TaxID=440482 RepID=UPI0004B76604|nr:hypothetical protein [Promicromonospora kroppenstedtii]
MNFSYTDKDGDALTGTPFEEAPDGRQKGEPVYSLSGTTGATYLTPAAAAELAADLQAFAEANKPALPTTDGSLIRTAFAIYALVAGEWVDTADGGPAAALGPFEILHDAGKVNA